MSSSTSNFTEASVPNQSGRVALVTGANTGIGYEAAGIDAISVASHPGGSQTELSRHTAKLAMTLAAPLLAVLSHPPAEAALTTLRAATDPDAKGGDYFGPGGFMSMVGPPVLEQPSAASRDPELARRLWDISIELTGVDPGL